MSESPTFAELAALEPRLTALEERARAIEDDGERNFFCSNFVWLPIATSLRGILGAYRRRDANVSVSVPDELFRAESFEVAVLHLSKLIPPCRNCGCVRFEPVRLEQLASLAKR